MLFFVGRKLCFILEYMYLEKVFTYQFWNSNEKLTKKDKTLLREGKTKQLDQINEFIWTQLVK